MKHLLLLCLFVPLVVAAENNINNKTSTKSGKLLSVFNVVKFRNDPCSGSNDKNGTCYTKFECEEKGGVMSGSCANNFGVCCILNMGCGGVSSENNTYFSVSGMGSGSCEAKYCPRADVCQIRLDFVQFTITGPSSTSTRGFAIDSGRTSPDASEEASQASQCLTDAFSVSSGNGVAPNLCGTITGEHMFVDPDPGCNILTFDLGLEGVGRSLVASRNWEIKISHFCCDYEHLAPAGCTQYFYGDMVGTVRTYNYQGGSGQQLANQNQNICVRREKNACKICWTATNDLDFEISGSTRIQFDSDRSGYLGGSDCCGYGDSGTDETGYDCILLPGGQIETKDGNALEHNAFCGRRLVSSMSSSVSATICQRGNSFSLRFMSDPFEFTTGEADVRPNKGFQLSYIQSTTC